MFSLMTQMVDILNTTIRIMLDIHKSCTDYDTDHFDLSDDLSYCEENTSNYEMITLNQNYRLATFYCALLMLCFCIVGVIGNVISILIFTRPSMRSSPINLLLTALSVVDCWVLATAVAVFVVPSLNTFIYYIDPRILYTSIVTGFYQMGMIAQTCSVWTFVLISLERYLAVAWPLHVSHLLSVERALIAELILVLSACLYNTPRFFEYRPDVDHGYAPLLRSSAQYFTIYYTTLYLLTHFLIPFLTIAILNGLIYQTVRRARRERKLMTNECRQQNSNTNRTTRMIVIVTLVFGTCNVLPFVLNIWEALEPDLFTGQRSAAAYLTLDVSNVLVILNSSSTFIIYAKYCQKYRLLLKRGVGKIFCRPNDREPPILYTADNKRLSNRMVDQNGKIELLQPSNSHVEMYEFENSTTPLLLARR